MLNTSKSYILPKHIILVGLPQINVADGSGSLACGYVFTNQALESQGMGTPPEPLRSRRPRARTIWGNALKMCSSCMLREAVLMQGRNEASNTWEGRHSRNGVSTK